MSDVDGLTRDDFLAIGAFPDEPERLFAATRGRDFDIRLEEWITRAAPHPDIAPEQKADVFARAWLCCSRWALSVGRRPAFIGHLRRAGAEPLEAAISERIAEIAAAHAWPGVERIDSLDDEELGASYALAAAADHGMLIRMLTGRERASDRDWMLALRLELVERGMLPQPVSEVSDYRGSTHVELSPTQLGRDAAGRVRSKSRLVRIVDEWCEFLEAGPSPIRYLSITSRAPRRLVAALRGQTRLRGLSIKWGDYDDISAVAVMPRLWQLELGGATSLVDASPLRAAPSLRVLGISDCRRLVELDPLADLAAVEEFEIASGMGSGALTVPTISFLNGMPALRRLILGARVLDEDYAPLLAHLDLDELWVRKQRVMRPTMAELAERIPALRGG